MIRELLLVHHSHTDIGYTHPQPIVFELHDRFIEAALDLAEGADDGGEASRFRWTCEVTGTTRAWWERASNGDRDRFFAAVRRGQIEVAALEWHLTPLADLRMLLRSLDNVRFFRDLGVPVRSAMNTDVNGVPWGLVDVLLDHGIDGFSMAVNSHLGGPVAPRPGAFRWAAPDGRELLVWNGFQYWHAANVLMRMPSSVEAVAEAMPKVLAEAERRGYALPYLPLQITNPHHPDNAPPDATLSAFIEAWNARDPEVRIRTVLLTEVFDRLRGETLPVLSGDWTDYWNLGAGSSSRETTVLMEGLRTLDAAHQVAAWPGTPERREADHLDAAHEDLALYAEHTWGADRSITHPESVETRMQWSMKSAYAYRGLAEARLVLRDALHRIATSEEGSPWGEAQAEGATVGEGEDSGPALLLYNPLPFPVRVPLRLPTEGLEWALNPGVHHRQRLDGSLSDLPESTTRWCDVALPALGFRTIPLTELPLSPSEGLTAADDALASSRVQIEFLEAGGVRSLRVDGVEYAGDVEGLTFGVPVLQRPVGGDRKRIMRLDFSLFEPAEGWQRDWPRDTIPGRLLDRESRVVDGAVEHRQRFAMDNGDRVEVVVRLFADDPGVDVEATLDSAGDASPYSLALPFTLPERGPTTWHFDTAGAVVEFDREGLPDAARHYVTARRFVRMQTGETGLSIATPDLPLWKFGTLEVAHSADLDLSQRRPALIAWLANNLWEVNFLANQTGRTRYRFRLLPHAPEPIDASVARALPYAVPPRIHAGRGIAAKGGSLLDLEGEGFLVEALRRDGDGVVLAFENLRDAPNSATLGFGALRWTEAHLARLDGTPLAPLPSVGADRWRLDLPARALVGVRLKSS